MDIIARLIEQLAAEDEVVRLQAGEFLIQMGSAAVRPLIDTLRNPYYPARPLVASTLGQIGDRRAVEPLIEALRDPDKLVRYHAALALGKLKDRRAVEPLIYALFDEMPPIGPDPLTGDPMTVRAAAAQALGELKAEKAVPALKVLLKDENRGIRRTVIQALGRIGNEEAINALLEAIYHEPDEALQRLIIQIVTRHLSPQTLEALRRIAQNHPMEKLRQIIKAHLNESGSGSEETLSLPSSPSPQRHRSLFRFSCWGVVAVLVALLFHLGWRYNRCATVVTAGIISVITFGIWKHRQRSRLKQSRTLNLTLQASARSQSETV